MTPFPNVRIPSAGAVAVALAVAAGAGVLLASAPSKGAPAAAAPRPAQQAPADTPAAAAPAAGESGAVRSGGTATGSGPGQEAAPRGSEPAAAPRAVSSSADRAAVPAKPVQAARFLAATDLPTSAAYPRWYAQPIRRGLPDPSFCLSRAGLPAERSRYRDFTTAMDAEATQIIVTARSAKAAGNLAAAAGRSILKCADDLRREEPGSTAVLRSYGSLDVGNGAKVYGLYTSVPDSEENIHLLAVGRDGDRLTVVTLGRMGTFEQAQVAGFKRTVRTSVGKLGG
jgi:hypothetical protein